MNLSTELETGMKRNCGQSILSYVSTITGSSHLIYESDSEKMGGSWTCTAHLDQDYCGLDYSGLSN